MLVDRVPEVKSRLAGFLGRVLRDRFGKGPESVFVTVDSRCIVFHLRNFLGPVEEYLLSQQEEETFRRTRDMLMKSILPELKTTIAAETGLTFEYMYYDWGLHHRNGIIVGLLAEPLQEEDGGEDYPHRQVVHTLVEKVSSDVQKAPERIASFWINPRTLVVFRRGILIMIEKELVTLGYDETLKLAKRRLEKRHLLEDANIGSLYGKQVADIFVDWNFEVDNSVIVYIMND